MKRRYLNKHFSAEYISYGYMGIYFELSAMLTLSRIASVPARKQYRIRFLFTHNNGLFRCGFCNRAKLPVADLLSG